MGRLRFVPKKKGLDPQRHKELFGVLRHALLMKHEHQIFYDLDANEDGAQTRRDLLFVAGKEHLDIQVRRLRKSRALQIIFRDAQKGPRRVPVPEYKNRVLTVLQSAGRPLEKREILEQTGLHESLWSGSNQSARGRVFGYPRREKTGNEVFSCQLTGLRCRYVACHCCGALWGGTPLEGVAEDRSRAEVRGRLSPSWLPVARFRT